MAKGIEGLCQRNDKVKSCSGDNGITVCIGQISQVRPGAGWPGGQWADLHTKEQEPGGGGTE